MHKQDTRLLWSAAALALGLVSAPSASLGTVTEAARAIDRLPEIRAALRSQPVDGKEPAGLSKLARLLAQWGNWPNWSNWGNG